MIMILVTGATSATGRALVDRLVADGVPVRAVSRKPDDAAMPPQVDVRYADLERPDSLAGALAGVDAVFLLHGGDPSRVTEVLAGAGIARVVFLSALVCGTRPESPVAAGHRRAEEALAGLDAEVTVLRPGQFASNTLWWAPMVRSGRVLAPFADVATPLIDPDDIAAVAATVLQAPPGSEHAGRTYPLTGPELISPRQRVAVLADTLHRPIEFVEIGADQALQQMSGGMPAELAAASLDLLGRPNEAERAVLGTVEQLTGRPARDFRTWAQANAAAFG
jgi:uncharacterized protein YbjT (DUF2867 family)